MNLLFRTSPPLYRVLTELVSKMRDMQMDKTELGCLRAIVLFNPGKLGYTHSFWNRVENSLAILLSL